MGNMKKVTMITLTRKLNSLKTKSAINSLIMRNLNTKKILEKLKRMLKNEEKYSEKQWQSEILDIILLLYPKYLYAFNEAKVKDFHSKKK